MIMNEMMTTFLPSVILILITYATTFFKAFYFEAALTVNLTTMLVLTTIFIAVMDKLPSTAYIKMVDIWLIFAHIIHFTEVMLLTMLEYYRPGGELGINHHGTERIVTVGSPVPQGPSPCPRARSHKTQERDARSSKDTAKVTHHAEYL